MPDDLVPNGAPAALERRLATILSADVAGYSEMMGANEERTVRVFRGHREIFESLVTLHRGRIFNTAGDALLAEFNSAVEAVRCATEIQQALATRNEHLAPDERIRFRIGINLGDVIVQGNDLLGDGVNVAARIQTATEPGGIRISGSVYDQIQNKLSLGFKPLGEQTYKNIAKPVRTYTISEGTASAPPARRRWAKIPAAIATVLALTGAAYWGYHQYDARRAAQARVESELAAQLALQKQATEQALRAAEEARRDAQKQAADDALRRAQEERGRLEQDRKLLERERRAADAAQKQAADDALRRAQEERDRLEQERKRLETDKRAAAAAPNKGAAHDGVFNGRLCNQFKDNSPPSCWPVVLVVRNGIAEGSWLSRANHTSKASGTVAADGALKLTVMGFTRQGEPIDAALTGRVADGAITAAGQWRGGAAIVGDWKRAPAAAKNSSEASPRIASYDGTYPGRLCNHFKDNSPPRCWPVALTVRNGLAEGTWLSATKAPSTASGTVTADGALELRLAGWTRQGEASEAILVGHIADGAITASGQWRNGSAVAGDWKRTP